MSDDKVHIELQYPLEMTPVERINAKLSLNPFKRRLQAAEHIAAMGVRLDEIHSTRVIFLGRTEMIMAALVLEEVINQQ